MILNEITNRLTPLQRQKLGEVVRFGIVGALATLLQYAIYSVMLLWCSPSLSMTVGYVLSFIFNFVASTRFTFKVETNAKHGAGFRPVTCRQLSPADGYAPFLPLDRGGREAGANTDVLHLRSCKLCACEILP